MKNLEKQIDRLAQHHVQLSIDQGRDPRCGLTERGLAELFYDVLLGDEELMETLCEEVAEQVFKASR